jgi:hypothetical protein
MYDRVMSMEKHLKNFLRNLNETKQIWVPLIILFIVLAPILAFLSVLGNSQGYILINIALSVLLSIGVIYVVYKVTEISYEVRFSQLVSIWIIFLIAIVICILILHLLAYFISASPSVASSSFAQGLMLQVLSLLIYLVTFCIIFVFFMLLLYLILSFNFDTFFPFICIILIIGLYLEYNQVVALGPLSLVLVFAIIFLIIFAIYGGLQEKEKEAMMMITLSPGKAAIIYALALIVFFLTYLITLINPTLNNSILYESLEAINIITLAIMLFVTIFLCSLFWTREAIVKWYADSPKKKAQIYKKE